MGGVVCVHSFSYSCCSLQRGHLSSCLLSKLVFLLAATSRAWAAVVTSTLAGGLGLTTAPPPCVRAVVGSASAGVAELPGPGWTAEVATNTD